MRRSHLTRCARLYAAVFNATPWKGMWTAKTAAIHIKQSLMDPSFFGLVAVEKGQPIAFAYGLFFQWENEKRFYLMEMCVDNEKRGGGIGTRLLTSLIEKLKERNVAHISLGTERDKPARCFYLKLGFKVEPMLIFMSKRLLAPGGMKTKAKRVRSREI